MNRVIPTASLCAVFLCATAFAGGGDEVKLLASDGVTGDYFGFSVAISGSRIAVGAPFAKVGSASGAGAVYLFDRDGTELTKLVPDVIQGGASFGYSVAMDGDLLLVGAPGVGGHGTTYLFDALTGTQRAEIKPGAGTFLGFGSHVAVHGWTALIGAVAGHHPDVAYLFDLKTGKKIAKLNGGGGYSAFGAAVALNGSLAVVGAPDDSVVEHEAGAAFVYDPATGQRLSELRSSDDKLRDHLGYAVAISGTKVYVSTPYDRHDRGAVFVFDGLTGQQLDKILSPFDRTVRNFGASLATDGDYVAVGVQGTASGFSQALTLIHEPTDNVGWTSQGFDTEPFDQYGSSVAINGDVVLVGAPHDKVGGSVPGSVYRLTLPGVVGQSYCGPAATNSSGESGELLAWGSDLAADNHLQLVGTHLSYKRLAMLLNSRGRGQSIPPGAQGTLCLGGAIGKHTADLRNSWASRVSLFEVDTTQPPTPAGPVAIQAGETWFFQIWYRDQAPQATSNFTDAVAIQFK